jgi:hypothetical protein
MNTEIIVALIGAAVTIANVTFTSITARKRRRDERTEQLEARVAEHNNFARRMPVIEEQIKVINHRLADIEEEEKHHD